MPFAPSAVNVYTVGHMRIAFQSRSLSSCLSRSTHFAVLVCFALFSLAQVARAQAEPANHLLIYAIDVEGGQSTLLVDTSTGASLLVDTGWQGTDARDPMRIEQAMRDAGIDKIDHVLITHFHDDHVG